MNDIAALANTVLMYHGLRGAKVDAFLIPKETLDRETMIAATIIDTGKATLCGVPVEVCGNLMHCVERSLDYCSKSKIGWILNLDPFRGMVFKPAFDEGEAP